jgi:hypothetical protein
MGCCPFEGRSPSACADRRTFFVVLSLRIEIRLEDYFFFAVFFFALFFGAFFAAFFFFLAAIIKSPVFVKDVSKWFNETQHMHNKSSVNNKEIISLDEN